MNRRQAKPGGVSLTVRLLGKAKAVIKLFAKDPKEGAVEHGRRLRMKEVMVVVEDPPEGAKAKV